MGEVLESKSKPTRIVHTSAQKDLRVLVLEDDRSQWPLWESVFADFGPISEIDWNTNEANAEALVRHAFQTNKPYDVIICDVFLGAGRTGIDLWKAYGETAGSFIFVSVMSLAEFRDLVEPRSTAQMGFPMYLQKPLKMNVCLTAIESILNKRGGENEQH